MADMRILLVLGADGAPFAHQLASRLGASDELAIVAPVVRDRWATGLKASPDLDALLAPVGGPATYAVSDELAGIGYSPKWHRPSDAEIAGQLIRTELLGAGYTLTEATAATANRRGLPFRLLPASDDRAELHVVIAAGEKPRAIHVAEYLADPPAHDVQDIVLVAETWSVSQPVREALVEADVIVLGPSSRTLAIDPVLRTPGLLDAIDATKPVLVIDDHDDAPEALIRASGMREPDPGRAEPVAADAVLDHAREVVR
jgi:LPPG:FO 2-phospho-L-lactate transferase